MNQEELRALLRSGIEAAQNNNTILARDIFREVLQEDPDNELAWMWLAQSVDGDFQRMQALEQVVRINPKNARAQEALQRLGGGSTSAAPASRATTGAMKAPAKAIYTPKQGKTQYPDNIWKGTGNRTRPDDTRLLLMGSLALLGIALIIGAFYMLIQEIDSEEGFPTPTPTGDFVAEDGAVPTNTLRPTNPPPTRDPNFTPSPLPPTFTPTNTFLPTNTWTNTPPPQEPDNNLTILIPRDTKSFNTIQADGTGANPLTLDVDSAGIGAVYSPIYSPDGNSVAFIGELSGQREVFVGDVGAGTVRAITSLGSNQTWDPAWSPDGRSIVFASDVGGTLGLYLVNIDGGTPTLLKSAPDTLFIQPEFSPDGNYIVYVSGPSNGLNNKIYKMPVSDPNIVCQLTSTAGTTSPAWSPDGKHIAFLATERGESDLFVMNADGSQEIPLSLGDGSATEYAPSWSPDGRFVAVISDRATEEDLARPTNEPNAEGTPGAPLPVQNRLWVVDVNSIVWYERGDVITTGRTTWQPTGATSPIADIGFDCAVPIPATSTPEGASNPVPTAEATTEETAPEGATPEATPEGTPAEDLTPTVEGASEG